MSKALIQHLEERKSPLFLLIFRICAWGQRYLTISLFLFYYMGAHDLLRVAQKISVFWQVEKREGRGMEEGGRVS